ncbi:MAG: PhnD/SsuA/transferrin family substrate-binding protein [Planctomycetes bacterium]|nr:PhnD/SsuA/transferrin family substrate-binding protein [Planctomycetota bacterium]
MGRVYGLVAWAVVPVAVALGPTARAAEPPALKIGLPETMFNGVPSAVAQTAARPFQTMFEKQSGFTCEIATPAKDHAELADEIRSGKIDVAVFHGFEYAWVRQHKELVPLLVTVPITKLRACLVVNSGSGVKSAEELKGACVAIPSNTKAHCRLYLERLKATLSTDRCEPAKLDGNTVEDALDAVAGGRCPAALVDAAALNAYQKDKPGAGKQLKVLSESDVFPAGVIVYRKDAFDAPTAAKIRNGLIKSVSTAQGKLLTSLWRLEGFAQMSATDEAELDRCLKNYPAPKK